MKNETDNQNELGGLTKAELIERLKNSQLETCKYVNKFLEVHERWTFINNLITEMGQLHDKAILCEKIAEGFLSLTNSVASSCCFFSQENVTLDAENFCFCKDFPDTIMLKSLLMKIKADTLELLQNNSSSLEKVIQYFSSITTNQLIVIPICYNSTFLGFFALVNENDNFYNESFLFLNNFPAHIALNLMRISKLEESERLNRQRLEFLAGISHEFKTPLNAIIGFTDILRTKSLSTENFNYIENISYSSHHLLSMIEDILDLSKSQYNSLHLNFELFSTKEVILNTLKVMQTLFIEKNISLSYTVADVNLIADKLRFRQLIFNFVSNAIKFNRLNGKIVILTYIENNNFIFEISDTGDGIDKKNYDKIFKFFSQANESKVKRDLGSGVGLALCKMIAEGHNGCVDFVSQYKKGSTFVFKIPLSLKIMQKNRELN